MALAAGTAADKAAAEALFDEGVKLLSAKDYAAACEKLDSSQKLDPGIGTLLYLGDCYEKSGRTASAWATFREAASMAEAAGQTDRARKGMARADKLTPLLSKLTIEIAAENREIEGLEVRREKQLVSSALFGSPVPVDPGPQTIVVSAPGYESQELKIEVLADAQTQTLKVPALVRLPEAKPIEEEPAPQATTEPATSEDVTPSKGNAQRTTGLVIGGVGIVGLGVGGVFGALAMGKNKDADCADNVCQTQEGQAAADDAKAYATVADVAFIAGGVLLATGAVIYFTAPRSSEVARLQITPNHRGATLSLGGSF